VIEDVMRPVKTWLVWNCCLLMLVGIRIVPMAIAARQKQEKFKEILTWQLQNYPRMEVDDIFKIVYQAAMGNKHMLHNPTGAYQYLQEEWSRVLASSDERLWEELPPEGTWVRVNLRPYKAKGWAMDSLYDVMLRSAQEGSENLTQLKEYYEDMIILQKRGMLPHSQEMLMRYIAIMQEKDYPPAHHSQRYTEAYKPAYRVVLFRLFHEKFLNR
jgi:hypothetical protein